MGNKFFSVVLKSFILSCTTFLVFIIWFPRIVLADSRFAVKYDLSYKVADIGITTVTQNFTLVNKTSEFLPQEYIAKIGNREIANVTAFDKTGPLPVQLVGNGDDRSIHIKFRALSAGYGRTFNWTLSYQTSQIARKNGQTWEIFIPRPTDLTDVDDYSIGLYVPASFGSPYLLRPTPKTSDRIWTKEELTTNGIFASYFIGQADNPYQVYDFSLHYHLYNSKLYPVESEVALPMDSNYQQVFLETLIPQPVNVRIDPDGNWLAKFSLGPASSLDVLATGSAAVFLRPQFKTSPLPSENDLFWQRYWETTDPRVASIAQSHSTAEQIYQQVIKNLKYDFNRSKNNISRLGASGALNSPNTAICLEFTDLFIALARAAGIPAREVDGYAASLDLQKQPVNLAKDILHSWPEYFNRESGEWIMVDPTWGATTGGIDYFHNLDTDHFAFVTKGQSSTAPSPAGTYKQNDNQTNDVTIASYQENFNLSQSTSISLRTNLGRDLTSGLSFTGKVYLDNNGPVAYGPSQLVIDSHKLGVQNPIQKTVAIPPFGHLELDFTINPISWMESDSDIITVRFAGFSKDYPVTLSPIYTNKYIFVIGGLTALGILSIFAQIARSIFF